MSNWGPISYTDSEEEEKLDPIMTLIQQYEDLKNSPIIFKPGESIDEARNKRQIELFEIDKKVWDLIYIKRQKNLNQ